MFLFAQLILCFCRCVGILFTPSLWQRLIRLRELNSYLRASWFDLEIEILEFDLRWGKKTSSFSRGWCFNWSDHSSPSNLKLKWKITASLRLSSGYFLFVDIFYSQSYPPGNIPFQENLICLGKSVIRSLLDIDLSLGVCVFAKSFACIACYSTNIHLP